MASRKDISDVYNRAKHIDFDESSKFILMSDCHRGDGSGSDNFTQNQNICAVALMHYYNEGFTYIELGDGDELWENKDFSYIAESHKKIFKILAMFHLENRFYMIYGNHDMVKKNRKWYSQNFHRYMNECGDMEYALFPRLKPYEGIVLNYTPTQKQILLLHGHQADFMNYDLWWLSRFLVRYLWRPLELIGIKDPTSPTNNHTSKNKVEQRLGKWAEKEDKLVVAGHTHRPAFANAGESRYFNDGACVFPHYITAIEISDGKISLVKWGIWTRSDGTLYVGREVLKNPRDI